MSMLNQAHLEAICSATYLENYLDCLETLPDELQRILTQIREVDVRLSDIESTLQFDDLFSSSGRDIVDSKTLAQLQRTLIAIQEFEDEKIRLSASLMEYIETRVKQLDQDRENLDPTNHLVHESSSRNNNSTSSKKESSHAKDSNDTCSRDTTKNHSGNADNKCSSTATSKKRKLKTMDSPATGTVSKSSTSQRTSNSTPVRSQSPDNHVTPAASTKKPSVDELPSRSSSRHPKKKRRSRAVTKNNQKEATSPLIDPDEPTYCLCDQVSYGEMIGCDNDACPIEWFHFNCVGLSNKPKGRWYCPKCRGDKPTVMKKSDRR